MAQWRREPKQVEQSQELGTLDVRMGTNETRFVNDGGGFIGQRGSHSTLQHQNKLIFLSSPKTWPGGFHGGGPVTDMTSIQTSVGLFSLQDKPTWELFIDGTKVESLPVSAKQGQRITIKDGVTHLGIIPLPSTDLGRDVEVVIEEGKEQKYDQYRAIIKPSLVINSYNFKSASPLPTEDKDKWIALGKAFGGFVIEMGDDSEEDFETFQRRLDETRLDVSFDDQSNTAKVIYHSGTDVMEASTVTFVPGKEPNTETGDANLVSKLINGVDSSLPSGVERDTPYAQQAVGRVEKNGATLEAEAGHRIFVLTEPKAGVYSGWNPLPDLTTLRFTTPGGITVTSDGRVGLTRIVVHQDTNTVEIDHAFKPGQEAEEGAATGMDVVTTGEVPKIVLNGAALEGLESTQTDGTTSLVVLLK